MWSVWLVFCDCGFHSACPQMAKDKRLMEASWQERLTVEKPGSCSDADKSPSSQSYGFSSSHVWMWELDYKESWAQKNWCFWTVVLEKTSESPLDCRRSNQLIPKEISPEYSLAELMLKLKLQYFGHLMQRTDSLEKTPMLGKTEGRRRRWLRVK